MYKGISKSMQKDSLGHEFSKSQLIVMVSYSVDLFVVIIFFLLSYYHIIFNLFLLSCYLQSSFMVIKVIR